MQTGVYAGSARFVTRLRDRVTYHSFSFGEHYDPANVGFGPLLVHNDDHLSWGGGYTQHRHVDVEIVTWVVQGTLMHTDSLGHTSELPAGTVQVQSAGAGIEHSELAHTDEAPTRFVQSWLRPDQGGLAPARFLAAGVLEGTEGLVPLAGAGGGLPLGTAGATLWVARLQAPEEVPVPDAPRQHVFVVSGTAALPDGTRLDAGDAARVTDGTGLVLSARGDTELLVWTLPD